MTSKQAQLLYVLTRSIVDSILTIVSLIRPPNHMPRLACPSVSAESPPCTPTKRNPNYVSFFPKQCLHDGVLTLAVSKRIGCGPQRRTRRWGATFVSTLPLWFRENSVAFRRSRCGFARLSLRFDAFAVVSREFWPPLACSGLFWPFLERKNNGSLLAWRVADTSSAEPGAHSLIFLNPPICAMRTQSYTCCIRPDPWQGPSQDWEH